MSKPGLLWLLPLGGIMALVLGVALGGTTSHIVSSDAKTSQAILGPLIGTPQPRKPPATQASRYHDDTFAMTPGARIIRLTGDMGLKPYQLPPQDDRRPLFLDLRSARFTVSNSRNVRPTRTNPCGKGDLPVNNNPLKIMSTAKVTIVGGLISGSVPQDSDWRATYCNSAAVQFRDSPSGAIDGIRIARAWDAIRIGRSSGTFLVKNSWLSEIRDDAIENDHLHSGTIEDTLIDGTLQGMSVRPNAKSPIGLSDGVVQISGSLIRFKEHRSEDGRWSMGSLVKNDYRAPRIRLVNSVIALDANQTRHWSGSWAITWNKLAGASNNLVLWLSDRPIPPGWSPPRQGFHLLAGRQARAAWASARQNWIDCHPKLARLAEDAASNFARCRPGTWGGYSS